MAQKRVGFTAVFLRLTIVAVGGVFASAKTFATEGAKTKEEAVPFSTFARDLAGDAIAGGAIASKQPALVLAGATYKVADLAHDLGLAALGPQDRWLGAQMVLVGRDAKLLKDMKLAGEDLNGPRATVIKERIRDRMDELGADGRSPVGYTARVIIKNLPYAVAKVAIDKTFEKALGLAFDSLGVSRLIERHVPIPASVNWVLNYGGPLEKWEKSHGWGKLGTRARAAEKAAEKIMHDHEVKIAQHELEQFGDTGWDDVAATAFAKAYDDFMRSHPSAPRQIVVASVRIEAARAAAIAPAPATALVPAPVAAMAPAAPDPVVRAIQTEDRNFREHYENPVPRQSRTVVAPSQRTEPQQDPRDAARWRALHEELMRVGDGKTFTLCSNGCEVNWDGRRK